MSLVDPPSWLAHARTPLSALSFLSDDCYQEKGVNGAVVKMIALIVNLEFSSSTASIEETGRPGREDGIELGRGGTERQESGCAERARNHGKLKI